MTTFQVNNIRRSYQENQNLEKEYLDVLTNMECDFVLEIDRQKILSVVGWNLVEFLDQLIKWRNDGMTTSFHYDCMDSDENLFDLEKEHDGFHFHSSWQENGKARPLSRHEILDFIERLKTETLDKVNRTFKVDLTAIKELEMK
ncbi:hypothetical protein [Psychroflexus tropicus]|uniref:DUF7878 domain-containing protein n=1 Tax=Psychroflexus tropicus TaxID=197345 RepID=UPI000369C4ED|nr:hypothetical protein [Psychroflexus tropicus]